MHAKITGPFVAISSLSIWQRLFGELLEISDADALGDGLADVLPNHEKNAVDEEDSKSERYVVV